MPETKKSAVLFLSLQLTETLRAQGVLGGTLFYIYLQKLLRLALTFTFTH